MYTYVLNNPLNHTDPTGMLGCQVGDQKYSTCTITVVYDPKTSKGTLTVTGQNKGDNNPTTLLTTGVVVGGDGHLTPTGTFTASVWEKDHVSKLYGSAADTPWSKTVLGGNASGPYQLHIKELDSRGIFIHGRWGRVGVPQLGAIVSSSARPLTGAYGCATARTSISTRSCRTLAGTRSSSARRHRSNAMRHRPVLAAFLLLQVIGIACLALWQRAPSALGMPMWGTALIVLFPGNFLGGWIVDALLWRSHLSLISMGLLSAVLAVTINAILSGSSWRRPSGSSVRISSSTTAADGLIRRPSRPVYVYDLCRDRVRRQRTGLPKRSLDYFGARYFSAAQGRFTSPDAPFADQHVEDPQSWNMYGYVRNNPLKNTDPNGRDCFQGASSCANYVLGGLMSVVNVVPNTATLLNHGINLLTGSNIPDAPTLQPSNTDQAQGMQAANAMMLVAPFVAGPGSVSEMTTAADVPLVTRNAAQGAAFQNQVAADTALTDSNVVQNVMVRTQSGVRTQIDVVSTSPSGSVVLQEAKSSATAPLTPNQAAAHPEIANTGATVVGQGKPPYVGGTQIPPTPVKVVRPPCTGGTGCSQ